MLSECRIFMKLSIFVRNFSFGIWFAAGGASEPTCPYNCTSEKFRMPHCYTMLEDLIHKLGGPYLFSLLVFSVMVTLACVLSVARMKLVGNDDFSMPASTPHGPQIDHSFPFLESLNEVIQIYMVFALICRSCILGSCYSRIPIKGVHLKVWKLI